MLQVLQVVLIHGRAIVDWHGATSVNWGPAKELMIQRHVEKERARKEKRSEQRERKKERERARAREGPVDPPQKQKNCAHHVKPYFPYDSDTTLPSHGLIIKSLRQRCVYTRKKSLTLRKQLAGFPADENPGVQRRVHNVHTEGVARTQLGVARKRLGVARTRIGVARK